MGQPATSISSCSRRNTVFISASYSIADKKINTRYFYGKRVDVCFGLKRIPALWNNHGRQERGITPTLGLEPNEFASLFLFRSMAKLGNERPTRIDLFVAMSSLVYRLEFAICRSSVRSGFRARLLNTNSNNGRNPSKGWGRSSIWLYEAYVRAWISFHGESQRHRNRERY